MWRIDEQSFPLPLRDDFADVQLGDSPREIILQQGDVLYLPRGFVHEPAVLDSPSLHLTVGVTPHRWIDLLASALIVKSQRTLALRRALPPGVLFEPARHHELEKPFQELVSECLGSLSLEDAVNHLAAGSLGEMFSLPEQHFRELQLRDRITEQSFVTRRRGMLCRVTVVNGKTSIQFPGNQVFGPRSLTA
jgi:hypothetical protein